MAKIRPARAYGNPDAPIRAIILQGRAGLRRDLAASLKHLRDVFDRRRARDLFVHGLAGNIYREAINWHHYRETLKGVFERWARIYEAAAQLGARKITGAHHGRGRRVRFRKWASGALDAHRVVFFEPVSKAKPGTFSFDRFDDDTQARIRQAQDDLIAQLTSDARDTIETAIRNGQRLGLAPNDIVDDIWEVIGLTDTQAQAVLNYENMLRELDPTALARQLRDDAYDRAYQSAIENDEPLSEGVIGEMVDAYEDNYYDYRAKAIAITESNRAGHQGLHDSYRQAVDRGAVSEDAVTRYWRLGANPCPICEGIADSNEDGVGVNEEFDSEDGSVDDPPVHTNCECYVDYVTDLSMVSDDEGDNEEEDDGE